MIKKKFKIEGMHCNSCALNIDFDLEDLSGVKNAKTSYAKQVSEIEYDEKLVDEKYILETIKKTGYSATIIDTKL